MIKLSAIAYTMIILLLLSGCMGGTSQTAGSAIQDAPTESLPSVSEPPPAVTQPIESTVSPEPVPMSISYKGNGTVTYADSGAGRLTTDQEALLCDYMNTYYTSLALLKARDTSRLFAEDALSQAENDRLVLEALIAIRAMQNTDLSLSGYLFRLTVQSIQKEENTDDIRIRAQEYSVQNFTAYPGVDSESFNVGHNFLLTPVDDGWRIREHRQSGSINRVLLGGWRQTESADVKTNVKRVLADARLAVERRGSGGAITEVQFDNAYDRESAAAYARKWADGNNDVWPVYDRLGGNCQNFTSQAIHAGGIPMDYTAPAQWKWYGDTPNASFTPTGRSPAWSGVSEFLSYVKNNSGYGMVAVADTPYYTGEIGDIIHLSEDGEDWPHTVMITGVMTDDRGDIVDYLVASNTADLRDFPVSAYYYTHQMLIKIYGWNN